MKDTADNVTMELDFNPPSHGTLNMVAHNHTGSPVSPTIKTSAPAWASDLPYSFTFFTDPGHGWLCVPSWLVSRLGIASQVSEYSYMGRDHTHKDNPIYLEEDCDAPLFMAAIKLALAGTGISVPAVKTMHTDHESSIRNLRRFC